MTAGTGSPDSSYNDTYTYDSVRNRLTKTHVVGTNTLSVTDTYDSNGDDRLATETATGTGAYSTTYSYDNNGSLILETRTGAGATTNNYTYDVQNHLVTAVIGNTTTNYAYDADGNRVSSTQGGTTTYFTIDDNNPTGYTQILEQATTFGGTPGTTYVVGQAVLGQANGSGVLSSLVTDGHGSTRILTDASGGITSRYDYDAFGNALTSITGTQILYAGQFFDSGVDLYNLRSRYYDPTVGRFTSFDSFGGSIFDPSSLQKFLYAGANPITNVDPTGHQFLQILGTIGIIGVVVGFLATPNVANAPGLGDPTYGDRTGDLYTWAYGDIIGVGVAYLGGKVLKYGANALHDTIAEWLANRATAQAAARALSQAQRWQGFSEAERSIAQFLEQRGRFVQKNLLEGAAGAGRQADGFVDGVETEFKTLTGGGTQEELGESVQNALNKVKGKAQNIVIDARGTGMTEETASQQIGRWFKGGSTRTNSIEIIGDNFFISPYEPAPPGGVPYSLQ